MKKFPLIKKILSLALCTLVAGGTVTALPQVTSSAHLTVSALQSIESESENNTVPIETDSHFFKTDSPRSSTANLILDPSSATLGKGETLTLSAYKASDHSKITSVIWKSSDTDVVTVTDGKVTAKGIGTASVTAKDTAGNKAVCTITIKEAATGITLNKNSLKLGTGDTCQLISTVTGGASYHRTFTSSSSSILRIIKTASGVCTVKAVQTGTATITVKTFNGRSASCRITVVNPVTEVQLDKTSLTLGKGEAYTLKATVLPSTAGDKTITWRSSAPSVVSVSAGKITAKAPGTATITAAAFNGKTASCKVTVKDPAAFITVTPTSQSLGIGETFKILSSVSSGASYHRTFTTSDSSIVRIVSTTPGTCTVKALKTGTATIKVKTYNGKTASCQITVKPAAEAIYFKKTSLSMGLNESYKLLTTVPRGISNTRTFTSSDPSVVKITETTTGTCTIKALKIGSATITVKTHNGKKATCKITVKKLSTSVSLQTNRTLLKIGSTFTLKCTYNADSAIANPYYCVRDTSIVQITSSTEKSFTIKALKKGQTYVSVVLPNQKVASCLIVVPDKSTNSQPIIFTDFSCGKPKSNGGVDVFIDIYNNSGKTIKSVTYSVKPYNASGEAVSSTKDGKITAKLKYSGPLSANSFSKTNYTLESYISDNKIIYNDNWYYTYWPTVWYNDTIRSIRLVSASIEYTDGTTATL